MLLREQELHLPVIKNHKGLLAYFEQAINDYLPEDQIPVRFVVTRTDDEGYSCELGVLTNIDQCLDIKKPESIFKFMPRAYENTNCFNSVLVVPTGIGAEIGGHAGDAGPVAKLLASVCDTLITHPNVVNASDINDLPENGLYVEGSVISELLMGTIGLQPVRSNRVLLVIDKHKEKQITDSTINSVSAARATLGLECPKVIELDPPVKMKALFSNSGTAVGRIEGIEHLIEVLQENRDEFDAVALASVINVPSEFHTEYFESQGKMVNPWGGVEAMLTHTVTMLMGIPTAHSPMFESMEIANLDVGVVDPRMSAEAVSMCFLHCILKGLHRSPRIIRDSKHIHQTGILSASDVSCLVIPDGCIGLPTLAALEQGIPVIAVRENRNRMKNDLTKLPFRNDRLFIVDNYLEAVGVMAAIKSGVSLASIRRPLPYTKIICRKLSEKIYKNFTKNEPIKI